MAWLAYVEISVVWAACLAWVGQLDEAVTTLVMLVLALAAGGVIVLVSGKKQRVDRHP